jgi:hypothetical protein
MVMYEVHPISQMKKLSPFYIAALMLIQQLNTEGQ